LIASALGMLTVGGCLSGYVLSSRRAEWSAYSLAANSIALQRLEQTRACRWDPLAALPVDELLISNFPPEVTAMDVPIVGTNTVYATNYTTIATISSDPPVRMM